MVGFAKRRVILASAMIVSAAVAAAGVIWAPDFLRARRLDSAAVAQPVVPPSPSPPVAQPDPAGAAMPQQQVAQAPPAQAPPLQGPVQAPAQVPIQPQNQLPPQLSPAPPAPPPAASASTAKQSDAEVVFTLIRTTLVALYQADVTGNYTVLRDLGSPAFREKNSAADLARIFAPVRDAKIDLGAAVVLDPHVSRAALNDQKMLDVAGTLETKPVPVNFELLFQPIDGVWRINGLAVLPVQSTAAAPTPVPAKPPAKKPAPKPQQ